MVTPGCAGGVMVILALAIAAESTTLVAVSVTMLGCGGDCGAR